MDDELLSNVTVSTHEKKKIVELYALKICLLYEHTEKDITDIIRLMQQKKLPRGEATQKINIILTTMNHKLSKLLIEQFYNTGEEEIFDRAMSFDEDITLEEMSILEVKPVTNDGAVDISGDGLLVPYEGIFLFFPEDEEPVYTKKVNFIIRDADIVEMINKKLARGRQILRIDEVTLGKKYFEGLCMRTHYH